MDILENYPRSLVRSNKQDDAIDDEASIESFLSRSSKPHQEECASYEMVDISFESIAVWWRESSSSTSSKSATTLSDATVDTPPSPSSPPQSRAHTSTVHESPSSPRLGRDPAAAAARGEAEVRWTYLCFDCTEFRTEYIGIPPSHASQVKKLLQHKLHHLTHINIPTSMCGVCSSARGPTPRQESLDSSAADWFCIMDFADDYYRQALLPRRKAVSDVATPEPTWRTVNFLENPLLESATSSERKSMRIATGGGIRPWLPLFPIVVPSTFKSEQLIAVAQFRGGGVPSLCWQHPDTKATICRATAIAYKEPDDEPTDPSDDDLDDAASTATTNTTNKKLASSPASSSTSCTAGAKASELNRDDTRTHTSVTRCSEDERLIAEIHSRSRTDLMHIFDTSSTQVRQADA